MVRQHRVGQLDIMAFEDGSLKTSLDQVLGFPREAAQAQTGADADGSLFISVNNFVFHRPDAHRSNPNQPGASILIDAGAADTMQPTLGKLPANLTAGEIPPASITHILLTHLHPDHANGLVGAEGRAVFANAEILLAAQEYDFWMAAEGANDDDAVKTMRARNRINLAPYHDRTRRLREGETVLGCTPILAPGHSPGHTCWHIETGGEALLAWGDIVHLASLQIEHPEVAMTYDLDREQAARSRRRILDMAATDRCMIAGAHLDAPGLGHIRRHGTAYAFAPC